MNIENNFDDMLKYTIRIFYKDTFKFLKYLTLKVLKFAELNDNSGINKFIDQFIELVKSKQLRQKVDDYSKISRRYFIKKSPTNPYIKYAIIYCSIAFYISSYLLSIYEKLQEVNNKHSNLNDEIKYFNDILQQNQDFLQSICYYMENKSFNYKCTYYYDKFKYKSKEVASNINSISKYLKDYPLIKQNSLNKPGALKPANKQFTHKKSPPKPVTKVGPPKPVTKVGPPKPGTKVGSPTPVKNVWTPKPGTKVGPPNPVKNVWTPKPGTKVGPPIAIKK